MKYLITRSSSRHAAECLRTAIELQCQFPTSSEFHQLVITDSKIDGLQNDIEQIVYPELSVRGEYAHGLVRELAFREALSRKVDYLITMDSDAVFLGFVDHVGI